MELSGRVVYSNGHVQNIPASAVDEKFTAGLLSLLNRVGEAPPLRKVPSSLECAYCRIPKSECPERIEDMDSGSLESIPDF